MTLEEEVEAILMERIRDKVNAERYDRMIEKREKEIAAAKQQIEQLQNVAEVLRSRQASLKRDIRLIDDILQQGPLSEAHLRQLVERIYVREKDGKISLEICIKAPFRGHEDIYEKGEQVDSYLSMDFDYDRLLPVLLEEFYEEGEEPECGYGCTPGCPTTMTAG